MSDKPLFTYLNCKHSSELPTIQHGRARMKRTNFWDAVVKGYVDHIPAAMPAVYIATGGGYGSFEPLIIHLKATGNIDPAIPSVKGNEFRQHPAFLKEMGKVREAIRQYLSPQDPMAADPQAVEQILSGFYSDEVNTKIVKGVFTDSGAMDKRFPQAVVPRAIQAGKSVIHESASIYPDTIARAEFAKAHGVTTKLIAGTMDISAALAQLPNIAPAMTAISYQKFAARFEHELVPLFDVIELYDSAKQPPTLIAEKQGAGEKLLIHDQARYAEFLAQAQINPNTYSQTADSGHALLQQHHAATQGAANPYPAIAPQERKRGV